MITLAHTINLPEFFLGSIKQRERHNRYWQNMFVTFMRKAWSHEMRNNVLWTSPQGADLIKKWDDGLDSGWEVRLLTFILLILEKLLAAKSRKFRCTAWWRWCRIPDPTPLWRHIVDVPSHKALRRRATTYGPSWYKRSLSPTGAARRRGGKSACHGGAHTPLLTGPTCRSGTYTFLRITNFTYFCGLLQLRHCKIDFLDNFLTVVTQNA